MVELSFLSGIMSWRQLDELSRPTKNFFVRSSLRYARSVLWSVAASCMSKPEDRIECGQPGITAEECVDGHGCCFDSAVENAKWCFQHISSNCVLINIIFANFGDLYQTSSLLLVNLVEIKLYTYSLDRTESWQK